MVCFPNSYFVRYTAEGAELVPPILTQPVDYVLYWVTSVLVIDGFYSASYSSCYPLKEVNLDLF